MLVCRDHATLAGPPDAMRPAWPVPEFTPIPTFGERGLHGCPEFRAPSPSSAGRRRVTVRLLTNIGRLWTGSEVWSNAAILSQDDRIAWVGPARRGNDWHVTAIKMTARAANAGRLLPMLKTNLYSLVLVQ